jgi:hypothetical protein
MKEKEGKGKNNEILKNQERGRVKLEKGASICGGY